MMYYENLINEKIYLSSFSIVEAETIDNIFSAHKRVRNYGEIRNQESH